MIKGYQSWLERTNTSPSVRHFGHLNALFYPFKFDNWIWINITTTFIDYPAAFYNVAYCCEISTCIWNLDQCEDTNDRERPWDAQNLLIMGNSPLWMWF